MKKITTLLFLVTIAMSNAQDLTHNNRKVILNSSNSVSLFQTNSTSGIWASGMIAGDRWGIFEDATSSKERFTILPGGNVGIGTTSPSVSLEVKSNSGIKLVSQEYTWGGTIKMVDGFTNTTHKDDMMFSTSGGFLFKMDENGNGVSNIQGFNVYDRNNQSVFSVSEANSNVEAKAISLTGHNPTSSVNGFKNFIEFIGGNGALVLNPGQNSELMFGMHNNGNFYWGTGGNNATNPNYYSMYLNGSNGNLGIKGKLTSNEVKVKIGGWADYVFKEDYHLPTLEEVEKHIKEKGHLINIPSAKEVNDNGIQLGEMNKLLLEKIEELTLYIIKQEKDADLQKEINDELELRISKLENLTSTNK